MGVAGFVLEAGAVCPIGQVGGSVQKKNRCAAFFVFNTFVVLILLALTIS